MFGMLAEGEYDHFWATISGPEGSPYENGTFELKVELCEGYPFLPPRINFQTKVFHPNISDEDGSVGVDFLREEWSPALTLVKVLLSIQSLMADPDSYIFLNLEATSALSESRDLFILLAQEMT